MESPSDEEATIGKGKKPSRSKGDRRGQADTESGSDEEARPKEQGVANPKLEVLAVPPLFLQESGHSSGMKFSRRPC